MKERVDARYVKERRSNWELRVVVAILLALAGIWADYRVNGNVPNLPGDQVVPAEPPSPLAG